MRLFSSFARKQMFRTWRTSSSVGGLFRITRLLFSWAIAERRISFSEAHRFSAAFLEISDLLSGDSACALAGPPFNPPRLPISTAHWFLVMLMGSPGLSLGLSFSNGELGTGSTLLIQGPYPSRIWNTSQPFSPLWVVGLGQLRLLCCAL